MTKSTISVPAAPSARAPVRAWWHAVAFIGLALAGVTRAAPPAPTGHAVLLAQAQAAPLVQQCSRAVPRITATWTPSARDLRRLEADLPHLKGQHAAACCSQSAQMDDAQRYYRQYAGVIRGGRRLIYINAFVHPPEPGADSVDWHHQPVIVCGGGVDNWGVLYDPDSRTFSQLAFNGAG